MFRKPLYELLPLRSIGGKALYQCCQEFIPGFSITGINTVDRFGKAIQPRRRFFNTGSGKAGNGFRILRKRTKEGFPGFCLFGVYFRTGKGVCQILNILSGNAIIPEDIGKPVHVLKGCKERFPCCGGTGIKLIRPNRHLFQGFPGRGSRDKVQLINKGVRFIGNLLDIVQFGLRINVDIVDLIKQGFLRFGCYHFKETGELGCQRFNDRHQECAALGVDRFNGGFHSPGGVGEPVRSPGKVPLGIGGCLHQVLIPEHGLLRLAHGVKGFRDTFLKGERFQIGNGHINAQLLQRLRFSGDTGADFLESRFKVQVIERCHVGG